MKKFINLFILIFIFCLKNMNNKKKIKKINNKYCDSVPFSFNPLICQRFEKQKKIIISMTSWPKRISNLVPVINSLLNQTIEPDLIELNLCILEFPNKEKNFPEELKKMINEKKKIEINWVQKKYIYFQKNYSNN